MLIGTRRRASLVTHAKRNGGLVLAIGARVQMTCLANLRLEAVVMLIKGKTYVVVCDNRGSCLSFNYAENTHEDNFRLPCPLYYWAGN